MRIGAGTLNMRLTGGKERERTSKGGMKDGSYRIGGGSVYL